MVVKWPPRLTLASGLFWWVCLNISEYAPKASANMQFPTNFDHWGVLQPCIIISDFRSASGFPWLPSPFYIVMRKALWCYWSNLKFNLLVGHVPHHVITTLELEPLTGSRLISGLKWYQISLNTDIRTSMNSPDPWYSCMFQYSDPYRIIKLKINFQCQI